jgi:hypothetical protein
MWQPLLLTANCEDNLIQMPCVTTPRATTTELIGRGLPKFETPLPDGFRGHDDPALGEQFFNVAKTERKTERQPHGVADNLRWVRWGHSASLG